MMEKCIESSLVTGILPQNTSFQYLSFDLFVKLNMIQMLMRSIISIAFTVWLPVVNIKHNIYLRDLL